MEIPTGDETADNIVAFWNPADTPQPGQELLFSYRPNPAMTSFTPVHH